MFEVIKEYPKEYCLALEDTYGKGMMSEGGDEALQDLFADVDLNGKKVMDFGAGLGGAVFYAARNYNAEVTGADINPWMVEEATRRIPDSSKGTAKFIQITEEILPFEDGEFDVVFSKGVIVQIKDKKHIFNELFRVLKPGGKLIINDWLGAKTGELSDRVREMSETEGLSVYPQTPQGYKEDLEGAGFQDVEVLDETPKFIAYNRQIAKNLYGPLREEFIQKHGEKTLEEHAKGYDLIAEAMEDGEMFVNYIYADKK